MTVPLGQHREITCRFQAPFAADQTMSLVLRTRKAGHLRFEEERRFKLQASGKTGAYSNAVSLE